MNRTLIITADDYGTSPQRSHGILESIENGIVTQIGIVPNASHSDIAGRHAKERSLPTGLQLTLTVESPLSKKDDVSSLFHGELFMHPYERFLKLLDESAIERTHIERELRAQIEWGFDTLGTILFISSTDHIHTLPTIAPIVANLMEQYGLSVVRIPEEIPVQPFGYEVESVHTMYVQRISNLAQHSKSTFEARGIRSAEHFRGLNILGHASAKSLRHTISKIPNGTTELMVHPGSMSVFGTDFDMDPQRQTELNMLTDESILSVLAEGKIIRETSNSLL